MKKIFLIIALFCSFLTAQEGIRPLTANPQLTDFWKKNNTPVSHHQQKVSASLSLPFFDDFSYFHKTPYPSQILWTDSLVYVNDGMGIAPLSQGVATFDGLNKKGFPYTPNTNFPSSSAAYADTLTSAPINLHTYLTQTLVPSDSIALIFYYQKGGWGDNPEVQDSLMLDFYKPNQNKWENRVWHSKGQTNPNILDTTFKRVFIFITDTAYLQDGFRFRFRNKAQTNGNFDVWNIDYVYLDKNRSMLADTAWNDLCFGRRTTPFLKRYSAMPWKHYQTGEMAAKYSNYIRYNGTGTVNTTYQFEVRDPSNAVIYSQSYGAANLVSFWKSGWQSNTVHSVPTLSFSFPALTDSADFVIRHYMNNLSGDVRMDNDTLTQLQSFRNYFAYDDGTCENGYYVLGTGGKAVYFYHLNVQDTLRALRIYFDPAGSISLSQTYKFRIQVYTPSGGVPGNRIYQDSLMNVQYSQSGQGKFAEYELTTPLVLPAGDYFIGYQQFVASGITVGLDRNYYFPGKLFYDSGNGWTVSTVKGSLMMRPVFGKKNAPVPVMEYVRDDRMPVSVFPNPASGTVYVQLPDGKSAKLEIFSSDGKRVYSNMIQSGEPVNVHGLTEGLYFYSVGNGENIFRGKLVLTEK